MLAMWSMTPLDKEFNGKWTHALPCVPLILKGRDFTPTLTYWAQDTAGAAEMLNNYHA